MQRRTALLWWHLNILNKTRYDAICGVYGTLEDASKHVSEEFLRGLGAREETVRAALMRLEEFDAERAERELEKNAIRLLSIEDEAYPKALRHTADPPIFLSYKGDLACLGQPLIACVGTRGLSPYGRRLTEHFVPAFVRAGCVTVSGLAIGIDTVVAHETLAAGGRHVAVLGSGVRHVHPQQNVKLAEKILATGGLLVSEFPLEYPPSTFTFPARNRIIAGLAKGTLVLEAPKDSGTLITAEFALEEGRDVFAVPGQIFDANFAGCNALIARGHARLVTDPRDVLREMGIVVPGAVSTGSRAFSPSSDAEKALWEALTTLPQTVDTLVEKVRMPVSEVGSTLTMMEIGGAVQSVGQGAWVRA